MKNLFQVLNSYCREKEKYLLKSLSKIGTVEVATAQITWSWIGRARLTTRDLG